MSHSLIASMTVPSAVNAYSEGVEYMKEWFLSKFGKTFFKNVHIDGKHISDDFKKFNITKKVKISKPNLSIIPNLASEFDRERVDAYPYGIENYVKHSNKEQAFFKDTEKNLYLGTNLDLMRINFIFRCRFQTKAQQLDVYKFMRLAFRIGFSQGRETSLDLHIPYKIMLKLALDAGFEVDENNKIKDPMSFLGYLNSHSTIPVIFKFRSINYKMEFFLRLTDMYVRIRCPEELQLDDGDRVGMLQDNFTIEMNAQLDMPSPKMYMYFSETDDENAINLENKDDAYNVFSIKLPEIPQKNKNGWDLLLNTDYESDTLEAPTVINFKELIEGDNNLNSIINYNNKIKISPSSFIDFALRNDGKIVPFKIDWNKLIITIEQPLTSLIINIFIYLDTKYINETIITKTELKKSGY